jgi:hypothetical protein
MTNDEITPAQFQGMRIIARLALRNLQRGLKYGEDMRSSAHADFLDALLHLNVALHCVRTTHDDAPTVGILQPSDAAAIMHEETGIPYERCLVMCNID